MTETKTAGSRKRTILISAGAVGAALVLVGGGVAVGAALADDRDDDLSPVAGIENDDDASASQPDPAASGAAFGATSAEDLMSIIDAAREVADGEVTSLDADRDGSWEVQLRSDTGAESEVRVDAAGTATLIESGQDDDRLPTAVLDRVTADAVVRAALAEAEGRIIDIDLDDDTVSPYDVTVLTGDGRTIDIDLAGDFSVVNAQADD